MSERFEAAPDPLHVQSSGQAAVVILRGLEAEVDELWSFVGQKVKRQWVWMAMDATTGPVLAFHVGDRGQESAEHLWANLPPPYREQAFFYTDHYNVSKGVIPPAHHRAISTLARKTTHVERCNRTLRHRVSRLVRATLSFSNKLSPHGGAIRYFIYHDNLTKGAALPG
jgi:IS1 family transposase